MRIVTVALTRRRSARRNASYASIALERRAAFDHARDTGGQVLPVDALEHVERDATDRARFAEARQAEPSSSPPTFLSRPVGSPAASFTIAPPGGSAESRVRPAARSAALLSENA